MSVPDEACDGDWRQVDRQRVDQPAIREGCFQRSSRIRRRQEFQQVYNHGSRMHGRFSTLFVLPNSRDASRLGIAATKKLGGAVRRNRAKRLIREIFRRNNVAKGFDIVVVPRRELFEASLTALEADYLSTLERQLRRRR
jgi:ribonuclease P protein component